MSAIKTKLQNFKKYFLFTLLFSLILGSSNLSAETVVYIEYNPVEDAYYRITVVDGNILEIVEVDENGVIQ